MYIFQNQIKDIIINILNTHYKNILVELSEKEQKQVFNFTIEIPPNFKFGHTAINIAMLLAKILKQNPRNVATDIKNWLLTDIFIQENIEKIEIAGAGFLNLFLSAKAFQFLLQPSFNLNTWLTSCFPKNNNKILFEFVSANPTGPLNIVSARAAATGDSLCRILAITGNTVWKEYYVNDYGNQVEMLGKSVAIRFLEKHNLMVSFPENSYLGEYIKDILEIIIQKNNIPSYITNLPNITNTEQYETWLSQAGSFFSLIAIQVLVEEQKNDLLNFNVTFDNFFSEKTLHDNGDVEKTFIDLQNNNALYEQDNAFFFRSTDYQDDKDRVVKRSDGRPTYLLADIAYHRNKFLRGYNIVYNIWGPDHHGYIARLEGSIKALEYIPKNKFQVLIIQQVNLIENGQIVVMSKRLGKFQTMKELIHKIPIDVSRYFFTARTINQGLDFDLELALDESSKNPVYYIQYAHARIHSIFKEAKINIEQPIQLNIESINSYIFKGEREILLFYILQYPNELEIIAKNLEIHRLNVYMYTVASLFTKFYHHADNKIIPLLHNNPTEAYLLLKICKLTASVIKDGLQLLGISAPTSM